MSTHTPKSATMRTCNPTSAKSTESPKPIPTNVGADQADRQGNSTSPGHANNVGKDRSDESGSQRGLPSFGPTEGSVNVAVNPNSDSSRSTTQTEMERKTAMRVYVDGDSTAGSPSTDTQKRDTAYSAGTAIVLAVNSVLARIKDQNESARLIAAAPDLLAALEMAADALITSNTATAQQARIVARAALARTKGE